MENAGMSKRRKNAAECWGVVVRLADGATHYYAPDSGRLGQSEWTPRANQAHDFGGLAAAEAFAAKCAVVGDVREYAAVPLTR